MLKSLDIGSSSALASRRQSRGLSLIELLVGVAVGLFVVAAATMLVATQLADTRRLLTETQVQQDLRATADIITREIRRATSAGRAIDGGGYVTRPNQTTAVNANDVLTVGVSDITFQGSRITGSNGPYGFRLAGTVIEMSIPDSSPQWQRLTDPNAIRITAFEVTAMNEALVRVPCFKLCSDGTQGCWPSLTVRAVRVLIRAQSVVDVQVVRELETVVRIRNDRVLFDDPGTPAAACPA
jgi:hypothetical protein